jgi:hypothetical protein
MIMAMDSKANRRFSVREARINNTIPTATDIPPYVALRSVTPEDVCGLSPVTRTAISAGANRKATPYKKKSRPVAQTNSFAISYLDSRVSHVMPNSADNAYA